ncbi:hypothetical protein [Lentzea aerocolonigenes]|nr:hypothetical protein [Lentzea aerocolonigenes]
MDPAWGVPTGVTGPGGAALDAFYSSKRVFDGDAFKVWITP